MLSQGQIKKILCDSLVVAIAERCSQLAEDGQLSEKVMEQLAFLDGCYEAFVMEIVSESSDVDTILNGLLQLKQAIGQ